MRVHFVYEYVVSTRTWEWIKEDPIQAGALAGALVATAHAEYTLATATHVHPWVAFAVPVALDLYVVRALIKRRDVFVAVLAMVAANVVSHLIVAGVLEVKWQIISAVGAIAPLVLWRVYSLKHTRTRKELLWNAPAGAVSAPVPEASTPYSEVDKDVLFSHTPYPDEVQVHSVQPAHLSGCGLTHPDNEPCSEYGYPPVPEYVPDSWMEREYPETHPSTPAPLYSVPDLPPEYAASTVTEPVLALKPGDYAYLAGAQEYADLLHGTSPSVRGLMKALSIGQDRAARLLAHLETEENR